jgi:hypothetical protein
MNLNRSKSAIVAALIEEFGPGNVKSADLVAFGGKPLYNWAADNLERVGARGMFALSAPKAAKVADVVDIGKNIRERFAVLEVLADGVASGNIRSLIVAGAPGVGKTFTLEQKLEKAKRDRKVKDVVSIKGSISAIGLYLALWENRKSGNVLILDDIDTIFGDEEAMNILKGALDTSKKRTISWQKASTFLRDNDVPNQFDYEGQVVFITNTDPDAVIAKGSKMSPHMNALVSRSVFLDLCIHDPRAIMIRVKQVMAETPLAKDLGLTLTQSAEILGWMESNVAALRSLSIRTVIQLASFVKTQPAGWQSLANCTMLKGH